MEPGRCRCKEIVTARVLVAERKSPCFCVRCALHLSRLVAVLHKKAVSQMLYFYHRCRRTDHFNFVTDKRGNDATIHTIFVRCVEERG